MPLNQKTKKEITVLATLIDLEYQGEIGQLLCDADKEKYIWNTRGPLWSLLILPCPMIKVNANLQ